jgi:polyhydroxybutyrate depolymerase
MSTGKHAAFHNLLGRPYIRCVRPIMLIVLLPCVAVGCAQVAFPPLFPTSTPTSRPNNELNFTKHSLTVNDQAYTYLLHIPPDLDTKTPQPVVLALHGYTQIASDMAKLGFNDTADQNGFVVIYPDSAARTYSWNGGGCCGPAAKAGLDDVAYIRRVLVDVGEQVRVDPKRIYIVGWSNGAEFAYRLACEMSDIFAAIAPYAGPLFVTPCQPDHPVSVMHMHGLSDTEVPYAGGQGDSVVADVFFPPVQEGIALWANVDGCSGNTKVTKLEYSTHTVYRNCKAGTAVETYTLEYQDHSWPNPSIYPEVSPQSIWNFFAAHPKQ